MKRKRLHSLSSFKDALLQDATGMEVHEKGKNHAQWPNAYAHRDMTLNVASFPPQSCAPRPLSRADPDISTTVAPEFEGPSTAGSAIIADEEGDGLKKIFAEQLVVSNDFSSSSKKTNATYFRYQSQNRLSWNVLGVWYSSRTRRAGGGYTRCMS